MKYNFLILYLKWPTTVQLIAINTLFKGVLRRRRLILSLLQNIITDDEFVVYHLSNFNLSVCNLQKEINYNQLISHDL